MENNDNESETPHVIIDNGSSYMRCGLNGEEGPRVVIRSRVGYLKNYTSFKSDDRAFYIGENTKSREGLLNFNYPINNGIIENWDEMEKIWSYLFVNGLMVCPDSHNFFLIDSNNSQKIEKKWQKFSSKLLEQRDYIFLMLVLYKWQALEKNMVLLLI